jgi:hypothetical protein
VAVRDGNVTEVSHLASINAVVYFLARGKWELKEK